MAAKRREYIYGKTGGKSNNIAPRLHGRPDPARGIFDHQAACWRHLQPLRHEEVRFRVWLWARDILYGHDLPEEL